VQLSKDIRIEEQSQQAVQAGRAIRTFARSTTRSIKNTLEPEEEEMIQQGPEMPEPAIQMDPDSEEMSQEFADGNGVAVQADPDSEVSEDDDIDPIDDIDDHLSELKSFKDLVVASKAFEDFKERLLLNVNPDQVRFAVFRQWPTLSWKSSRQPIWYHIKWDLESVDEHLKDSAQLRELVTLTGDAVDAEALSSREYLSRTCPDIGMLLLDGIEHFLLHKSYCKVQVIRC
jgi:hypothetical protein